MHQMSNITRNTACVQGSTIGTNRNANGTIGSPNGTISKPMVPLGEPRTEPLSCGFLSRSDHETKLYSNIS